MSSMVRRCGATLGAALILAMSTGQVHAHSFNVGFIAPLSGPRAPEGKRALDGFLMATREQDGHAREESDGHLGGLDSYVLAIDTGQGMDAVRGRIEALVGREGLAFMTGILSPETRALVAVALRETPTILVDPTSSAVFRSTSGIPDGLTTMDGGSFAAAFLNERGYAPDAFAARGYIGARLIAATVRAVAGNFSESNALKRALDRARARLP